MVFRNTYVFCLHLKNEGYQQMNEDITHITCSTKNGSNIQIQFQICLLYCSEIDSHFSIHMVLGLSQRFVLFDLYSLSFYFISFMFNSKEICIFSCCLYGSVSQNIYNIPYRFCIYICHCCWCCYRDCILHVIYCLTKVLVTGVTYWLQPTLNSNKNTSL